MESTLCFGVMGMEPNQKSWWNGIQLHQSTINQTKQTHQSNKRQLFVFVLVDGLFVGWVDWLRTPLAGGPPALFALFFSAPSINKLISLINCWTAAQGRRSKQRSQTALQSHLFISLLNQLFISFIINGREKEKSPWIGWRACFLFWLVAVRLLPPITNQKTTQCATNQFH